jgi:hypothetical protein
MNKKLRQKLYGAVLFFAPFSLMADDYKSGLCKMMGLGATFAFFLCVFFSIEGIIHWKQGGSFIKDIVGVIVTASAIAICTYVFIAFGLSDATLDPTF